MKKAAIAIVIVIAVGLVSFGSIAIDRAFLEPDSAPSSPLLAARVPSGQLDLQFDKSIPPKTQTDLVAKVLPAMTQLLGQPWNDMRVWVRADPTVTGSSETAVSDCQPGVTEETITVKYGSYLPGLIQQLASAYHGCLLMNALNLGAEEGIAGAAKLHLLQMLGLVDKGQINDKCPPDDEYIDSANNRPGIGAGQKGGDTPNNVLSCAKERLEAVAIAGAENLHNGFLKDWNTKLYQAFRRNGFISDNFLGPVDPLAIGSEVWPGFANYLRKQHVFDPRPFGDQLRVIALACSVSIAGVRHNADGNEVGWAKVSPLFTITQNKAIKVKGPVQLDQSGDYTYQIPWVSSGLVANAPINVRVQLGDSSDQLTYTPQPQPRGCSSFMRSGRCWRVVAWACSRRHFSISA